MKNSAIKTLVASLLISFSSCSQNNKTTNDNKEEKHGKMVSKKINTEPHNYGGWYCPDNLRGFPPVDIANWNKVPVIHGRMPTKEEAQSEASLIFVDAEKYPESRKMATVDNLPTFATFKNGILVNQIQTNKFDLLKELVNEVTNN